jgi:glycosyltransferase involved in cell wall biosynthesis
MNLKINISVIIPVYNHQNFIVQCLDSLLSQDYKNWEGIIINDGSTDDSLSIIKEYAKKDSRFVVIDQQNMGIYNLHVIYNNALKISRGEYIAVLEGDDYWPNNKLSSQIKSFKDIDVGLSWGNGVYVDINGNEIYKVENQQNKWGKNIVTNYPIRSSTKYFLFASNFFNMPTCSVMYRKKVLADLNGFWQPKGLKWLDKTTWILVSLKYKFAYCDFNTGYWRRHDKQVTSTNTDIKTTLEYISNSNLSAFSELKNYIQDFSLEIKIHLCLTSIKRLLNFNNFFRLLFFISKLFCLALLNPIKFYKHLIFILQNKKP